MNFFKKGDKEQKWINYAYFMPNYECYSRQLQWLSAQYCTTVSCESSASSLKDFLSEDEKNTKKRINDT